MSTRHLRWAALTLLVGACSSEAPAPRLVLRDVMSPAGPDSGEPYLSVRGDSIYLSWLERSGQGGHDLRYAAYAEGAWAEPRTIVHSDAFFVNWADFPSLEPGPDGALWAHWLERPRAGASEYGIHVARSDDGGASWSTGWTPHQAAAVTEHGFVASIAMGENVGYVWLDARAQPAGTALYFRAMGSSGPVAAEELVDARVCECCQTDAAVTAAGPVVVYRDRSEEEVRDIHIIRWAGGEWTEPMAVHADGWQTGACPVNGPAVTAFGEQVAVAWFTAADQIPRVKVAFSSNSGATFGAPTSVDSGNPAGRVDVTLLDDGSALVSWLERTGGDWAEVQVRHVAPSGRTGEALRVSASTSERASGYPRMIRTRAGDLLVAWTDVSGGAPVVRVAGIQVITP